MPILKREPDIFPASLFDLEGSGFPWRVAHVRSRQEKALARYCAERQLPFYLPLTQHDVITKVGEREPSNVERGTDHGPRATSHEPRTVQSEIRNPKSAIRNPSRSRLRTSYTPLFPGYVFLRVPDTDARVVRMSNVIVSLLEVADQQSLAGELGQIHDLQRRGAMLVPFPWLTTGDAVRIRDGAFKGYEGVIVKEKGEARLVVSISMIRQSVIVELSREAVAPGRNGVAA